MAGEKITLKDLESKTTLDSNPNRDLQSQTTVAPGEAVLIALGALLVGGVGVYVVMSRERRHHERRWEDLYEDF